MSQRPNQRYQHKYNNNSNNPHNQNRQKQNFSRQASVPQVVLNTIDVRDQIPPFKAEDYVGFKDVLLTASLPGDYNLDDANNQQNAIERTFAQNQRVITSLLYVAQAFSDATDSISQPPNLSPVYLDIERANMDLQVSTSGYDMLHNAIHEIVSSEQ